MSDLREIKYYLGLEIERDEDALFKIHQENYQNIRAERSKTIQSRLL